LASITVTLTPEKAIKLREIAKARGTSQAAIIHEAIEKFSAILEGTLDPSDPLWTRIKQLIAEQKASN
jgi:predicted transcriptional regulator